MTILHLPFEVIDFWFNELHPHQWFEKDPKLDEEIRTRFGELHERAMKGELHTWRKNAMGRLAEILILDQFSRNIYRGTKRAYESDPAALILAEELVQLGFDKELPPDQRVFAYLPFMHSESKLIHHLAMKLYSELGHQQSVDYEIMHKNIIERFGRFPHRNKILGRESTREEKDFVSKNPDF